MIKPLHSIDQTPQLAYAKPRCGLQSMAELIPRLIRQYEIQAQMRQHQAGQQIGSSSSIAAGTSRVATSQAPQRDKQKNKQTRQRQTTFPWFE